MDSNKKVCSDGSARKKRSEATSPSCEQPCAKHAKLNRESTLQVSPPNAVIDDIPAAAPCIGLSVQPRQNSIGLHSGVTKALFCITVSTPASPVHRGSRTHHLLSQNRTTIIVQIESSAQIRKVHHPRVTRLGKQLVLVPLSIDRNNHFEDILVQVIDLPHDLYLKASVKWNNSVEPIKCSIQRPNSDTVSRDAPYVQAQLLLYAATKVLKDFRAKDLENLRKNKKGRVEEVLRMIHSAPMSIQNLSVVKELELKLTM